MTPYDVAEEAEDFLREFTQQGRKLTIAGLIITSPPLAVVGRLLALAGRRPKWKYVLLAPQVGRLYTQRSWLDGLNTSTAVSLQVMSPEVMEARGALVASAVLLAVARYDATERGRCPVRLRALASVVLTEGHAVLTSPQAP